MAGPAPGTPYPYTDSLYDAGAQFPGSVMTPIQVKNEDLNGHPDLVEEGTVPVDPYEINLSEAVLAQTSLVILVDGSARTPIPFTTTLPSYPNVQVDLETGRVRFSADDYDYTYSITYTGKGSAITSHIINKMQNEIAAVQTEVASIGDVVSSTGTPVVDNSIVRYDGTDGTKIQESSPTINDAGAVLLSDGSASLPSLTFLSETGSNTGLFWGGQGAIGITCDGSVVGSLTSSAITWSPATTFSSTTTHSGVSAFNAAVLISNDNDTATGSLSLNATNWSLDSPKLTLVSKGTNPTTYTDRIYLSTGGKLMLDKNSTTGADVVIGTLYVGPTNSPVLFLDASRNVSAGTVDGSTITASTSVVAPVGAVGTPTLTFAGDTDTGIYHYGTNEVGVAAGGTLSIRFSGSAVTTTLPISCVGLTSAVTNSTALATGLHGATISLANTANDGVGAGNLTNYGLQVTSTDSGSFAPDVSVERTIGIKVTTEHTGATTGDGATKWVSGIWSTAKNTGSDSISSIRWVRAGEFYAEGSTAGDSIATGIYATATNADTNWAGQFIGNVQVTGLIYGGTEGSPVQFLDASRNVSAAAVTGTSLVSNSTLWQDWPAVGLAAPAWSFSDAWTWECMEADTHLTTNQTTPSIVVLSVPYLPGSIVTRFRIKWRGNNADSGITYRFVKRDDSSNADGSWTDITSATAVTGAGRTVTTVNCTDTTIVEGYTYAVIVAANLVSGQPELYSIGLETSKRVY